MIKAPKLQAGDKVAAISLSWGGAGELPHRYQAGVQQLEQHFGLQVVPTKHALKSVDWIYQNPKARAEDLMDALLDPSIKGIISNVGGDDSVRTLPYMDLQVIRDNPKIFIGFSDTTVTHFAFYKAGVTSFSGTSLLVGFAENNGMFAYQVKDIKRTLFSSSPIGIVQPNQDGWTTEHLDWFDASLQSQSRKLEQSSGWRWLQGQGQTQGPLLGGCVEVMEFLKGTEYWPNAEEWKGKILFLEPSEEHLEPNQLIWMLRNYAATGILKSIAGLIFGRPHDNLHWKEYDQALLKVIVEEEGLSQLPIVTGMDFGHTCPSFTLPYGIMAELDCEQQTFAIIENAVV